MIFGMLNPENLTRKSYRLVYLTSDVAKTVIFNSIIHTYFWLFTLPHKKTICNPLAQTTWKCHHINLWIAKLFHLAEGLLRYFKRWRLWKGSEYQPYFWFSWIYFLKIRLGSLRPAETRRHPLLALLLQPVRVHLSIHHRRDHVSCVNHRCFAACWRPAEKVHVAQRQA